jgi:hypothetical protein
MLLDFGNYIQADSPSSSVSSIDEDDLNTRVSPQWSAHRHVLAKVGVFLETVRDVRTCYQPVSFFECEDDDALCPDPGLVRPSQPLK